MQMNSSIITEIETGKGWALLPQLPAESISYVKEAIFNNFTRVLSANAHQEKDIRSFRDLESYHLSSIANARHGDLWSKANRLLDRDSSIAVKSIFLDYLSKVFSSFDISDAVELGFHNIYWRLVRPYSANDVGPAHRDNWFWIVAAHQKMPAGKNKRYKVRIPLIIVDGKNALSFINHSQCGSDYSWGTTTLHGRVKPYLICDETNLNFEVADCKIGQPIMFSDEVIHKGPINETSQTRVSIEFTLCVNQDDIL